MKQAQASTMRSLERALRVYEGLQRAEGPQRLSDIAQTHQMNATTVLRILRVLKEYGMVDQVSGSYTIGPRSLPAAQRYLQSHPLPILAIPVLDELARTTHLTASLYSRVGDERILIARSDGQHPLRYVLPFGIRLPLTRGAAGKVLLQGATREDLARVLTASVALGHEGPDADLDTLAARLGEASAGFATSSDERETGVVSVGVAVPRRQGAPTESLSLTSPSERTTLAGVEEHIPELRRAAARLAERLEGVLY